MQRKLGLMMLFLMAAPALIARADPAIAADWRAAEGQPFCMEMDHLQELVLATVD